jgi:aminoglycoside phosphotransferase (APT) family kinase protein
MLSSADYRLIRCEPDLPGLNQLLDEDAFAETLQQINSHLSIYQIRKTYIRYKPATSCLVGYELDIGKPIHIYAKAFATGNVRKLKKYEQRSKASNFREAEPTVKASLLTELQSVILPCANDYKLTQLNTIISSRSRQALLQRVCPQQFNLKTASLQVLRYKPERRWVAKLQDNQHDRAIIKAYIPKGYSAARRNAEIWQTIAPSYTIPTLGESSVDHLLIFPWITGQPLSTLLNSGLSWDVMAQTGEILAQLHHHNSYVPTMTRSDEATQILTLASDLTYLCPQWTKRIQTIAVHLATHLLHLPNMTCLIHGDFNTEQVLVHGNDIKLIDFDRSVCGDPAIDLGSLIAKLHWSELRKQITPTDREGFTASFLSGYRTVSSHSLTDQQVLLHTAVGLLRISSEPFRSGENHWLEQIDLILQRIEFLLKDISIGLIQPFRLA